MGAVMSSPGRLGKISAVPYIGSRDTARPQVPSRYQDSGAPGGAKYLKSQARPFPICGFESRPPRHESPRARRC